jgi:hypothetical protein
LESEPQFEVEEVLLDILREIQKRKGGKGQLTGWGVFQATLRPKYETRGVGDEAIQHPLLKKSRAQFPLVKEL